MLSLLQTSVSQRFALCNKQNKPVSIFWLLRIMLLWMVVYQHLFEFLLSILLDIPKGGSQGNSMFVCFWGTTILISTAATPFAFPLLVHLELIFVCGLRFESHSFACDSQHHLLKTMVLPSLKGLGALVENQLVVDVWVYFWTPNSIPYISVSIFPTLFLITAPLFYVLFSPTNSSGASCWFNVSGYTAGPCNILSVFLHAWNLS